MNAMERFHHLLTVCLCRGAAFDGSCNNWSLTRCGDWIARILQLAILLHELLLLLSIRLLFCRPIVLATPLTSGCAPLLAAMRKLWLLTIHGAPVLRRKVR